MKYFRRSIWVYAAATTVLLVAPTAAASAEASSDADAAQYVAQRERLDLRSDLPYVEQVSQQYPDRDPIWGISLTPAEHQELDANVRANQTVLQLDALLSPIGIYSGAWISPHPTSINLAVTRTLTDTESALVRSTVGTTPTSIVQRSAPLTTLTKISRDIVASSWWSNGYVVSAKPVLQDGTVEVGLTSAAPADAASRIEAAFGPLVTVLHDAPVTHATGGPRSFTSGNLRGGEWIASPRGVCSNGYTNVRNAQGAGGHYGITAGHCASSGNTIYRGHDKQGGPLGAMGSGNKVTAGAVTDCDCKQYGPLDIDETSNGVYGNDNVNITMTASSGSSVGTYVCMSGARTYNVNGINPCGVIKGLDISEKVNVDDPDGNYTFTLVDGDTVNILPLQGDSGGSIYSGASGKNKLYGFMSAGIYEEQDGKPVEIEGFYSEVLNVDSAGVTVKYN